MSEQCYKEIDIGRSTDDENSVHYAARSAVTSVAEKGFMQVTCLRYDVAITRNSTVCMQSYRTDNFYYLKAFKVKTNV